MKIEIQGIEELNRRLAALPNDVGGKALKLVAQAVYGKALEGADKHTKTGLMLKSTFMRKEGEGYRIGHDAPYAVFVHWGTKPHIIRPKDKKRLRWPSGGRFIFAKEVHHPGYAGDKWLEDAADYAIRNFDEIIRKAL